MLMANSRYGLNEQSDIEILAEVSAGDIDAYGKIVRRYQGRLYNFVFRFVGDRETAEDIVQEAFFACVWKARGISRNCQFFYMAVYDCRKFG